MKNKKKWLSLLTIATSLVLCIISTFGITLAFFGGNASANLSTITLKTGIEIGAAIKSSVGSAKVVPGQPVKITATGTVSGTDKGNADANNAVDGVVRAKFNVGNELGEVTIAGNTTDHWTAGNDGYYYLVTAQNGTTLRTVSKGTSVQIFGDLVVSKNFTNADSGKSVEASVIFEVVQADIYKADGSKIDLTIANATGTGVLKDAFDAVKMEVDDSYTVTITFEMEEGVTKIFGGLKITADEHVSDTLPDVDKVWEIPGKNYNGGWSADFSGESGRIMVFKTKTISFEYSQHNGSNWIGEGDESFSFYDYKNGKELFVVGVDETKEITLTSDVSYYVLYNGN